MTREMISSVCSGAPIHLLKFQINLFLKDFLGAPLVYSNGSLTFISSDIRNFSCRDDEECGGVETGNRGASE